MITMITSEKTPRGISGMVNLGIARLAADRTSPVCLENIHPIHFPKQDASEDSQLNRSVHSPHRCKLRDTNASCEVCNRPYTN